MSTPPPPPVPGGAGQTVTVNKDNVLAAGKIITDAVEKAKMDIRRLRYGLVIDPAADDGISTAAASHWNHKLLLDKDSHYQRLMEYIRNVDDLARQMAEAAKQYGYTDDEIAASFQTQSKQI